MSCLYSRCPHSDACVFLLSPLVWDDLGRLQRMVVIIHKYNLHRSVFVSQANWELSRDRISSFATKIYFHKLNLDNAHPLTSYHILLLVIAYTFLLQSFIKYLSHKMCLSDNLHLSFLQDLSQTLVLSGVFPELPKQFWHFTLEFSNPSLALLWIQPTVCNMILWPNTISNQIAILWQNI